MRMKALPRTTHELSLENVLAQLKACVVTEVERRISDTWLMRIIIEFSTNPQREGWLLRSLIRNLVSALCFSICRSTGRRNVSISSAAVEVAHLSTKWCGYEGIVIFC
jgi:hypothetical protein